MPQIFAAFARRLAVAGSVALPALLASPVQAALVAHWAFDNNTNVGEATVSTSLSVVGDAAFSTDAKIGAGALSLDGSGDYLRVDVNDSLPSDVPIGGSVYTLSTWILPTSTGDRGWLGWGNYGFGNDNQVNAIRLIDLGSGSLNNIRHYWWANDLDVNASDINVNLFDGNWHHIAATYAPSSGRTVYINGIVAGTDPSTAINAAAQSFRLGSTNTITPEDFGGRLDDVAIWDEALSADQVTRLYQAGLAGVNASDVNFVPVPSTLWLALTGVLLLSRRRLLR